MNSRIRVGIHLFSTYPRHPGRDGANFAYRDLARLLSESPRLELIVHDIGQLFKDDDAAREALRKCDVVVASVGPHAYLYFHLREKLGLHYRIIRDVRTALWNGYLLQEVLVTPYLRPEDSVFYSSAYSRDLFHLIFPNVSVQSQHVCYPLRHWLPPRQPISTLKRSRADKRTIGYVGRLTDDKNFSQAIELIAALERRQPGRFRLIAVGQGKAPNGYPSLVSASLGEKPPAYTWVKPVSHTKIWDYYSDFDVLFFPSTSSLETLGRVLVEATYAGVPVLASSHGATSELLDADALLPTRYYERQYTVHFAARLGEVDVQAAVDRLVYDAATPLGNGYLQYWDDAARFIKLVCIGNEAWQPGSRPGTQIQKDFIGRVIMHDLHFATDRTPVDRLIERLRRRFVALHSWYQPCYLIALAELLAQSRWPGKTVQFIRRSVLRHEDFTNIGGIDLQFSHLLGFYPSFSIR